MKKILVHKPIAELDGDEMTRVLWAAIKDTLIFPFLDITLDYYDLGLLTRDATEDEITKQAAKAILQHRVGVKCATITPDADRLVEYGLKKAWPSPNGTIRNILDGTVFRKPIICPNLNYWIRNWQKPIVIARHAYGDLYKAVDVLVPGPGKAELVLTNEKTETKTLIHTFNGPGVLLGMHNSDESILAFANSCFTYALQEKLDIWFATKDTISKVYHGRFRNIFATVHESQKSTMAKVGIEYRYMLIDDAVAQIIKHPGGLLWACTNYDGDIFSDMVASGFGSLGLMSSVLQSPSGAFLYEAAHGTVKRHYKEHLAGHSTSTNPVASIFAWSGALGKRAELDNNKELGHFANCLEQTTLSMIYEGFVTKDLLPLLKNVPKENSNTYETTNSFIDKISIRLHNALQKGR